MSSQPTWVGTEQTWGVAGHPKPQALWQESPSVAALELTSSLPPYPSGSLLDSFPAPRAQPPPTLPPVCLGGLSKKPQAALCGKCIWKHEICWKSNETRVK